MYSAGLHRALEIRVVIVLRGIVNWDDAAMLRCGWMPPLCEAVGDTTATRPVCDTTIPPVCMHVRGKSRRQIGAANLLW